MTEICDECRLPFDIYDMCNCGKCFSCCPKDGDCEPPAPYRIYDHSFSRVMEPTPYNGRISPATYPKARDEINSTRGIRMHAAWGEAEAKILHPSSILREAEKVIEERKAQYDERERNFARIATIWSVVFGQPVTPEQVAMCLIGMKLAREVYKPSKDNLTDICGYADCLADLRGYYAKADPQAKG